MKIYYLIPIKSRIQAIALWPFILANKSLALKKISPQILLHEKIHHRQQLELLVLPFYLWYILEWLFRWWIYRDRKKAYRAISFEQEAYAKDRDIHYLEKRKPWSFLKYL